MPTNKNPKKSNKKMSKLVKTSLFWAVSIMILLSFRCYRFSFLPICLRILKHIFSGNRLWVQFVIVLIQNKIIDVLYMYPAVLCDFRIINYNDYFAFSQSCRNTVLLREVKE